MIMRKIQPQSLGPSLDMTSTCPLGYNHLFPPLNQFPAWRNLLLEVIYRVLGLPFVSSSRLHPSPKNHHPFQLHLPPILSPHRNIFPTSENSDCPGISTIT